MKKNIILILGLLIFANSAQAGWKYNLKRFFGKATLEDRIHHQEKKPDGGNQLKLLGLRADLNVRDAAGLRLGDDPAEIQRRNEEIGAEVLAYGQGVVDDARAYNDAINARLGFGIGSEDDLSDEDLDAFLAEEDGEVSQI